MDIIKQDIVLFVIVLLIVSISGCTGQAQTSGKGTLTGKVMIGPLCPVEKYPPDPSCQPTAETYKAWQIWVWNSDKNAKVAQIQPELNGNYKLELPTGKYVVALSQNSGIGGSNLPVKIVISNNKTTTLNIDIDTGIR